MAERKVIVPNPIIIPEGRLSFFKGNEASYKRNKQGQEIKVDPRTGKEKKPQFGWTWLIDPSKPWFQGFLKEIKTEAARQLDIFFDVTDPSQRKDKWPQDNKQTGTKGIYQCWGNGNDLNKVYDGYKDMFYVKVSSIDRPVLGNSKGGVTVLGDKEHPYGGCCARGRIGLYVFNNESAGVNANPYSCFFLKDGPGFGGGQQRSAEEEYAAFGDAPASQEAAEDPFAT